MATTEDPLAQLYDIEGLDAINWWPLAFGWWVIVILILLALITLAILYWRKRRFERSWRYMALKQLTEITQLQSVQLQAIKLSELVRRIAIHQYSRKECASLTGRQWLNWLNTHDPAKFDWENQAIWLISAPYAPPSQIQSAISEVHIEAVVQAIKRWIK